MLEGSMTAARHLMDDYCADDMLDHVESNHAARNERDLRRNRLRILATEPRGHSLIILERSLRTQEIEALRRGAQTSANKSITHQAYRPLVRAFFVASTAIIALGIVACIASAVVDGANLFMGGVGALACGFALLSRVLRAEADA